MQVITYTANGSVMLFLFLKKLHILHHYNLKDTVKKLLLIALCPLFCYSQQTSNEAVRKIEAFFQEHNCSCDSYDVELLMEWYGFDAESEDVSPAIAAVNSYCEGAYAEVCSDLYDGTKQIDNQNYHSKGKLKRGQYKVYLKEINKTLAARYPDQADDFFLITELELNISDEISGFISGNSYAYHSVYGEFTHGRIKDDNTVEFAMLWTEEGSTYEAGTCSIEIIDDSTLKLTSHERYFYINSGTGKSEFVYEYSFQPNSGQVKLSQSKRVQATIQHENGTYSPPMSAREGFMQLKSHEKLYLSPGRVELTERIKLSGINNIQIIGDETSLVAKLDMPVVQFENTHGVTLKGLFVVHEIGENCAQNCVEFYDASQLKIEECTFDGSGYMGLTFWQVRDAFIENNNFYNCHYGFAAWRSRGLIIRNNSFGENRGEDITGEISQFTNDIYSDNLFK